MNDQEIIEQYFPWLHLGERDPEAPPTPPRSERSPEPSEACIIYDSDDEDTAQSVEVVF